MSGRRIAFYAPLKAPSHPTPSGDRRMGRLLIQAIEAAGGSVQQASDFRSYDGRGDADRQLAVRREGAALAAELIEQYRRLGKDRRPTAWFTYHLYHKAPDWLGPAVSAALDIPYLVAEASFAPKRQDGPWDLGHDAAAKAIAAAHWVFCLTRLDMACVEPLIPGHHHLRYLPPFLDPLPFAQASTERTAVASRFGLDIARNWLLAVAMMRPGDKLDSYHRLGAALSLLDGDDWQLLVIGDGSARDEAAAALAPMSERDKGKIVLAGALSPAELPIIYAACDLYLWPGVGEAYGMAYLEAQAAGLPVVAGNERGVPDVVCHDRTGLLTPPGDDAAFAAATRRLLDDDGLRHKLSKGASSFVNQERTVAAAAGIIGEALA